jgi:hypothetical protein
MKRVLIALLLAGVGLSLAPATSHAQSIEIGPRGLRVDPYGAPYDRRDWRYRHYGVSEWEARRIARAYGLARVWNSFRTRDVWVVSGEDWRRHHMRVVIDEDNGRVVDIDRGWRRW